jgi:hypothetical protein
MGAPWGLLRREPALLQLGMHAIVLRAPAGAVADIGGTERALEAPTLDAACAAVRALLAGHDKTPIHVHLACAWSRLLLLPWMDQLTSEQRWRTYAQARFEQVFGEDARDWELQLAIDAPGRDRIVVAWPVALRDALAAHANVRSVRVGLLEHLGVLLRHEPAFTGCLTEIETDGAGFVLLVDGAPRRLRWCRFDTDEALASAVRSEWANVLAADSAAPGGAAALAVTPPVPLPGSARALTIGTLATGLGFGRAFSLPEWP